MPVPPLSESSPVPPLSVSSPPSPLRVSLPPEPLSRLLSPSPLIVSSAEPPVAFSTELSVMPPAAVPSRSTVAGVVRAERSSWSVPVLPSTARSGRPSPSDRVSSAGLSLTVVGPGGHSTVAGAPIRQSLTLRESSPTVAGDAVASAKTRSEPSKVSATWPPGPELLSYVTGAGVVTAGSCSLLTDDAPAAGA